jgi:hypothetical protein
MQAQTASHCRAHRLRAAVPVAERVANKVRGRKAPGAAAGRRVNAPQRAVIHACPARVNGA